MYLDVCVLRDKDDEAILAIAAGDDVVFEKADVKERATVYAVNTMEKDGDDYRFAAACFGDDPEKVKIVGKVYVEELEWN